MSRIEGGWELVSWKVSDSRSNSYGAPEDYKWSGTLIYTHDGYMAANIILPPEMACIFKQLMPGAGAGPGLLTLSYSGKYTPYEDKVIHHVMIANVPSWIGSEQVRFYKIENGRLVINSESEGQNGQKFTHVLVWERRG